MLHVSLYKDNFLQHLRTFSVASLSVCTVESSIVYLFICYKSSAPGVKIRCSESMEEMINQFVSIFIFILYVLATISFPEPYSSLNKI